MSNSTPHSVPRGDLARSRWATQNSSPTPSYRARSRNGGRQSHDYSRPRSVPPSSRSHASTYLKPQSNGNQQSGPTRANGNGKGGRLGGERSTSAALANTISSSQHLSPAQALRRFEQICQRLRWKRIDLENSYDRALNFAPWSFTQLDAERNFKVDFHEFYVWIEQAVVLVLCVFGVHVAQTGYAGAAGRGRAGHTFHHDVLRTVQEDKGPLGKVLGRDEVVQAFWKAKELRNRWKGAHVSTADDDAVDFAVGNGASEAGPPLKMYDLEWLVKVILMGLDEAYLQAKLRVEEASKENLNGNNGSGPDGGLGNETRGDEGWHWMVEQMDWESN